ncbi:hypothetical protein TPHA_0E00350 [Tetrapisispora phaffii CBS 4417]|uniref:TLC domain-containing protein n=1 Tax=Tetrapisispora phaffii (strain ATCC 24235 / CBS 4417 / NBRC 1672 / NRRL Y-8282 / UCD 70-5) TaxID=1071381 RepID=G8BTA3_TETPH|nr:hypothetical protein TPHA_0E00350 [Tetrapisispora phaffii CBS 4417]CCE63131.1 hypothetical protein TPHA_0E00350 [Tetrapisispora phaffii CBS 4417]
MSLSNDLLDVKHGLETRIDPFIGYSWFPESDNLYLSHLHEIFYSFLFYTICYNVFAPKINKIVFGKYYTDLPEKKDKRDYDIHTVSMIQSAVSYAMLPFSLFVSKDLNVAIYYDHLCTMVSSLALGYFIWDITACVGHYDISGSAFIIHAIVSSYIAGVTLIPLFQPWIGAFLAFEASTPFVNVHWYVSQISAFAKRHGQKSPIPSWIGTANGLFLMLVFFAVRIVWGISATTKLYSQIYLARDLVPKIPTAIFLCVHITLNFLNIYWFSKMLAVAKGVLFGNKKDKQA